MKDTIKTFLFITLGVLVSWLAFGQAIELNIKDKSQNNFEKIGIIYRSNDIHKISNSKESLLTEQIKKVLAENPKTAALDLNITTSGSRITISGKADNKDQIQSAIQATLKIPGVKEVISTVVVDPDGEISSKNSLL